jgi:hypothetical protein
VKTGGRLVKHARYYWLTLAESDLTRGLFGSIVRRIDALAVVSGQGEPIGTAKPATTEVRVLISRGRCGKLRLPGYCR